MKRCAAVLLGGICIAAAPADPAAVAARVRAQGARAVVTSLVASAEWDGLMDRIEAGDASSVRLAPLLAPGTDAATGEGLGIALAGALPRAPQTVLEVVQQDGVIGVARVCGIPFIETSKTQDAAYRQQALAALARVHVPALAAQQRSCIARLEQ